MLSFVVIEEIRIETSFLICLGSLSLSGPSVFKHDMPVSYLFEVYQDLSFVHLCGYIFSGPLSIWWPSLFLSQFMWIMGLLFELISNVVLGIPICVPLIFFFLGMLHDVQEYASFFVFVLSWSKFLLGSVIPLSCPSG